MQVYISRKYQEFKIAYWYNSLKHKGGCKMQLQAHTLELKGTSNEIGRQQGKIFKNTPMLAHHQNMEGLAPFTKSEACEADALLARWCPGIQDELAGFAEETGLEKAGLSFYAMSCLRPRCSQMALNGSRMADGAPLLARNYDFNPSAEDFTLVRTSIQGKYTHLGTSTMTFGRDEGMNEHGLSVAMSSCGLPVGALKYMQPPTSKGLIFWVVIRSLLENCRNLDEALAMLQNMPIAFNLNMIVMDAKGNAALIEALDGKQLVLPMENGALYATNHALAPEFKPEKALRNSIQREQSIQQFTKSAQATEAGVKQLLLTHVEEGGLFNPYYEDFLGTTKSIVMRPAAKTLEICWGGLLQNWWQQYAVNTPLAAMSQSIELQGRKAGQGTFDFISL